MAQAQSQAQAQQQASPSIADGLVAGIGRVAGVLPSQTHGPSLLDNIASAYRAGGVYTPDPRGTAVPGIVAPSAGRSASQGRQR